MSDALDTKIRAFLVELVDATPSAPEFDAIEHEPVARRRPPKRRLVPALVAAAVVIATVGVVVVASRDEEPAIRAVQTAPEEVRADALSTAQADLVVFMRIPTSDVQVAAVRDVIAHAPEVRQFAAVSQDDTYRDFERVFSCRPDLVGSIKPQDLPPSFRLIGVDTHALAGLRTTLLLMPGVQSIDAGFPDEQCDPSSPTGTANEATSTPTPPTMPEADGPEPADPTAARAGVVGAFTQAFTGTNTADVRHEAVQHGDGLVAALDEARARFPAAAESMTVEVSDVRLLDASRAAVIYTVTTDGMAWGPAVGYAVLEGDQWKVSGNTICNVLVLAAVRCPAF